MIRRDKHNICVTNRTLCHKRADSPNNIPRVQQFYHYLFLNFEWVKACDAIKPASIAATPLNPFKIETAAISHHWKEILRRLCMKQAWNRIVPGTRPNRAAIQTSPHRPPLQFVAATVWLVPHALALSLFDIIFI
jgi:hypothetical protein